MTRRLVLTGLLLGAVRPLAAQRGFWLSSNSGPGIGLTLPIGRHFDVEPGIYLQYNHTATSQDSNRTRYRFVTPGITAGLRWLSEREAAVALVGALQVTVGRRFSHSVSDYTSTFSYHYEQTASAMEYSAGLHGGVQVRLSSRASLSLEHHVDVILVRGTIEQSSTFTGGGVPPSTSTQSDRETTFRNGFEWRVRIYRKSVSTQGGN